MVICPKCKSTKIAGPKYERSTAGEYLRYRCERCGYTAIMPNC